MSKRIIQIAIAFVILIGTFVLLGWQFDIDLIKFGFPNSPSTMKPNTALCFLLAGMALGLLQLELRIKKAKIKKSLNVVSLSLSGLIILISLLTLNQYIWGWNLGIDESLFLDITPSPTTLYPGRMGEGTAFNFLLVGINLLLLRKKAQWANWLAQTFSILTIEIALLVVVAYLFESDILYQLVARITSTAPHTAITFIVLNIGLLGTCYRQGFMEALTSPLVGGIVARQLLPWLIVYPILVTWLTFQGQQLELYDAAFGYALGGIVIVPTFIILTWWTARSLNQLESDRQQAEVLMWQLAAIVESSEDAIISKTLEGVILSWNVGAEKLFGYKAEEIIGQSILQLIPETQQQEEGEILAKLKQGVNVKSFETVRQHKDGSLIDISLTVSPVKDKQGKIVGASKIARDISFRKQAEKKLQGMQKLQKERQLLETILETILAGYWDWNIRDDHEYLSPTFKKMFGYEDHQLPNTPESWQQMIVPEDLPGVLECFEQHIKSRGQIPYYNEVRYRHRNGSIIWVICSGRVIEWDSKGNPLRMVGCHINISDRKHIEQQLELQDTIVRNMAEGVCLVKAADGTIVYANPKFEQMFGYETGELVGQFVAILNHQTDTMDAQAIGKEIMTRIGTLGEYSYEIYNVKKDSTPFWCRATTSQFQHPEYGIVYVAVHEDITQRKTLEQELAKYQQRIEQELAHSQQLLNAFVASAPVGMCVVDRQLCYTLANEALAEINGISIPEHLGKTPWEMVPDLASTLVPMFQQAFTSGETVLEAEVMGKTPKLPGVTRTWLVSNFPILNDVSGNDEPRSEDNKETIDRLGVIFTEITERKQAEEHIKASLREKEVLLQEIHHRVKNNLQIVDSLLQLQARRTKEETVDSILLKSRQRIKTITLVHEKLYLSENFAKIDFSDYIHSLTSTLLESYKMSSRQTALTLNIIPIALDINTAVPCGLILNELISNAIKHAFPRDHPGHIWIELYENLPNQLILKVRDNGIGIPQNINLQTTRSLGLTLVQGLVGQLEGNLEIDSDQGTLVTITFPMPSEN
jgi:PAS domain S-box-containing protein